MDDILVKSKSLGELLRYLTVTDEHLRDAREPFQSMFDGAFNALRSFARERFSDGFREHVDDDMHIAAVNFVKICAQDLFISHNGRQPICFGIATDKTQQRLIIDFT